MDELWQLRAVLDEQVCKSAETVVNSDDARARMPTEARETDMLNTNGRFKRVDSSKLSL